MKRLPLLGITALVLGACSDYDLHRPDKPNPEPDEEPEPEPEPPEDPDIAVSPASIDFGNIPRHCEADVQELTITNEGLGTLEVTAIAPVGQGNEAFVITDWDGSAFSLEYGETRTFTVAFDPPYFVTYAVDIEVTSNDPDEALVEVGAAGEVAEDALYEETFVQEYHELVDVLWVVDNSCSMDEEVNQVQQNFEVFINEFVGLDLDYHLAVVTTDMDDPTQQGRIQGGVVTPDSADPVTEFMSYVNQGSSGSGSEKGFAAVEAALSEPLLSSDNAGFLREDAALSVIVLSDENDDSSLNPSSFVSWFDGLKADPELSNFNSICGDRGWGCQEFDFFGNTLSASGGDEYIDATDLTGGYWASICTSDYTELLQHISLASAGMTVEFPLSQEPSNSADLSVSVDGVAMDNDSTDGWTYSNSTNIVTFHGDSIPGPGAEVTVSYPVAGECP